MEEAVLFRNPFIRSIFEKSEFLFDRPETINEISFQTKQPVENHILMIGDAAGMIAPLCGNGMAMAIHSAKIVSERLLQYCHDKHYTRANWSKTMPDPEAKVCHAAVGRKNHSEALW